jgi:hypothetical protein
MASSLWRGLDSVIPTCPFEGQIWLLEPLWGSRFLGRAALCPTFQVAFITPEWETVLLLVGSQPSMCSTERSGEISFHE